MNIFDYIKKEYGDIEYLTEGAAREVYSFANGEYILKIPLDESFESGVEQSEHEYNVYTYVESRFRYLLAPIVLYDTNFDGIPLIL